MQRGDTVREESSGAPPYLSPMEMRRGQGIWGEEHREAALHNLKGILMNQHSRSAYSHDNRPQTNSCI
ncbi:Protein transport protein SEC24-2 [Dissostichus eleginoides]|uniref:Protein transport protein SEC24-2 n=1 Tax=Dissostichus eleginoides TaxID=100907 RepID=A0AAD9C6F7_DISEL|nr:Protein transport protein SEC24-2 [Dissostichus eleginoides]